MLKDEDQEPFSRGFQWKWSYTRIKASLIMGIKSKQGRVWLLAVVLLERRPIRAGNVLFMHYSFDENKCGKLNFR